MHEGFHSVRRSSRSLYRPHHTAGDDEVFEDPRWAHTWPRDVQECAINLGQVLSSGPRQLSTDSKKGVQFLRVDTAGHDNCEAGHLAITNS